MRVPKAGGTLFKVDSITSLLPPNEQGSLADSSLLLLADILPTGVFAAMQALQHPKVAPFISGAAYPYNGFVPEVTASVQPPPLQTQDRTLTFAVVGLGPVGVVRTRSFHTQQPLNNRSVRHSQSPRPLGRGTREDRIRIPSHRR